MAVPFTQLASTYLDNYGTELNDALKRANGVIAVLGAKGKIKEERGGGDNFRTRVMYAGNPNVAFGDPTATVGVQKANGITMASVPQRFIRGSIVIGDVDRDRAVSSGEWAIGNLINDNMRQAETAYVQSWADALLQTTPGANDPLTLLPSAAQAASGILSPQAPASQTATTAGISRGDNSWWRNQYSSTSIDISGEAGRALLHQLYLQTVFGSSETDEPDFGLTTGNVIADIAASIDTNRRADYADKLLAQLGLKGIMFQNAMLIRESSTQMANKVCFLNSRDLYLKFLTPATPNAKKENWNQNNGLGMIPTSVLPFQHDIDSFHTISLFYAVASLVPAQLRTLALADNVV